IASYSCFQPIAARPADRPAVESGPARRGEVLKPNDMKPSSEWGDPLLIEDELAEEERMVRDSARAFCQEKLMPRVTEAHRHEKPAREVFREMGALGCLGPTIEGYGCAGVSHVCYGLIAREIERVDS